MISSLWSLKKWKHIANLQTLQQWESVEIGIAHKMNFVALDPRFPCAIFSHLLDLIFYLILLPEKKDQRQVPHTYLYFAGLGRDRELGGHCYCCNTEVSSFLESTLFWLFFFRLQKMCSSSWLLPVQVDKVVCEPGNVQHLWRADRHLSLETHWTVEAK